MLDVRRVSGSSPLSSTTKTPFLRIDCLSLRKGVISKRHEYYVELKRTEQSRIGILSLSPAAAAMYAMAHQELHRCTRRLYAGILSDNF